VLEVVRGQHDAPDYLPPGNRLGVHATEPTRMSCRRYVYPTRSLPPPHPSGRGFKPPDCTVCSVVAIPTPRYYTYSSMVFSKRVLCNMTGRFLRDVLYLQNTEWPHAGRPTVEWLQPYKNDICHNATVNRTDRTRSEKFVHAAKCQREILSTLLDDISLLVTLE
jgi:hypothetical protein